MGSDFVGSNKDKLSLSWGDFFLILIPIAIVYVLFMRVIEYPFLDWDDGIYITNRTIFYQIAKGDWGQVWNLFSPSYIHQSGVYNFFPLRDLTFAWDAWRGGMSSTSFHWTNLHLHACNVGLIYIFARLIGLRLWFAGLAAVLFSLHPLTVEPVVWATGRKDLLYVSFGMVGLISLWKAGSAASRSGSILGGIGFLVALLLSLGSKGQAVSFSLIAFVLMLFAVWGGRKLWIPVAIGFVVTFAYGLLLVKWGRQGGQISSQTDLSPEFFFRALGIPLRAISQFLVPLFQSPDYGSWTHSPWEDPFSWGTLALLGLFILLWRRKGTTWLLSKKSVWLLVGCFLTALFPVLGFLQAGQIWADRYLYLPLIFMVLFFAWALQTIRSKRFIGVFLMVIFISVWGIETRGYQEVWSSDFKLWARVYQMNPDSTKALRRLGKMARDKGKMVLAQKLLNKALQQDPKDAKNWHELGNYWVAWMRKKQEGASQMKKSIQQINRFYEKALRLHPRSGFIWASYGNFWFVYAMKHSEAKEKRRAFLKAERGYVKAYRLGNQLNHLYNQGLVATRLGDYSKAERIFRLILSPKRKVVLRKVLRDTSYFLSLTLWHQKKYKEARQNAKRWLKSFPKSQALRAWLKSHPLP